MYIYIYKYIHMKNIISMYFYLHVHHKINLNIIIFLSKFVWEGHKHPCLMARLLANCFFNLGRASTQPPKKSQLVGWSRNLFTWKDACILSNKVNIFACIFFYGFWGKTDSWQFHEENSSCLTKKSTPPSPQRGPWPFASCFSTLLLS